MSSHRIRCCGDCLAGEHEMGLSESWRTDFLKLVRRRCVCADCDCTFCRVIVLEPRYDQRHHHPYGRGRRWFGPVAS